MKHLLVLLMCAATSASAAQILVVQPASAPAYTGDLNTETFNTAAGGGPNSNGCDTACTITAGTPNTNYTAVAPASGSGEALYMDGRAATQTLTLPAFANRNEVYGAFLLYIVTYPGASREIMRFNVDGSQANTYEIRIDADGDIEIQQGTQSPTVTDNVPTATWVAVYFHIVAGTGADGVASIEWSTTFEQVGSGTKFAATAVGTSTLQMDQLVPNAQFSTSGPEVIIDDIFASTTAIPSNPWNL